MPLRADSGFTTRTGVICADMKRLVALLFLSCLGVAGRLPASPAIGGVQFAKVSLRIVIAGERQPSKEAGAFVSDLPLGTTGHLDRRLLVTNATRGSKLNLALRLAITPSLDDGSNLHCVVLSGATPEGGKRVDKFRDLVFSHPGAQIMELYSDKTTGYRVLLSISAEVDRPSAEGIAAVPSLPPISFLVRVERWVGAQRDEIEQLQLQSLEGKSVSHDYSRNVPHWVADKGGGDEGEPTETLPVVNPGKGKKPPVIQAGQSFTILLHPKTEGKRYKNEANNKTKPAKKKLVWRKEYYHLSLLPLSIADGRLSLSVRVQGRILDPITGRLLAPIDLQVSRKLLSGQPASFYLTRETKSGPVGYVVWIVPRWKDGDVEEKKRGPAPVQGLTGAPKNGGGGK